MTRQTARLSIVRASPQMGTSEPPDVSPVVLVDDVADWLIAQALDGLDLERTYAGCCVRPHAAGAPLARAHIAFRTLHPLFEAGSITWRCGEPLETMRHGHRAIPSAAWRRSPLHYLIENDLSLRRRRGQPCCDAVGHPGRVRAARCGPADSGVHARRFGGPRRPETLRMRGRLTSLCSRAAAD